jgi:hypothetical protein
VSLSPEFYTTAEKRREYNLSGIGLLHASLLAEYSGQTACRWTHSGKGGWNQETPIRAIPFVFAVFALGTSACSIRPFPHALDHSDWP